MTLKITDEQLVRLAQGYRKEGAEAVFVAVTIGAAVGCGILFVADNAGWVPQGTLNGALAICAVLIPVAGFAALYPSSH